MKRRNEPCLFCLNDTLDPDQFEKGPAQCPKCGQFTLRVDTLPLSELIVSLPSGTEFPCRQVLEQFSQVLGVSTDEMYATGIDFDLIHAGRYTLISVWLPDTMLTTDEVASILDSSVNRIGEMIGYGELPGALQTGKQGHWLIPLGAVKEYLLGEGEVHPAPIGDLVRKAIFREIGPELGQLTELLTTLGEKLDLGAAGQLPFPSMLLDQLIIANARLEIIRSSGYVPEDEKGITLPAFDCALRGYLVRHSPDDFSVAAMLGSEDAGDLDLVYELAETLAPGELFEYWLLEGDQAEFFEIDTSFSDEEADDDAPFENIHLPALFYLLGVFVPERAPYKFYGALPYEVDESRSPATLFATLTRATDPVPTSSASDIRRQFRQQYAYGRYWVAIQSDADTALLPTNLIFVDSLALDVLDFVDEDVFSHLQQAAIRDRFYDDPDTMPPHSIEWITRTNATYPSLYDLDEFMQTLLHLYDQERAMGLGALLELFDPSEIPYLLLGIVPYDEEDEESEVDQADLMEEMIACPWAKPTSSPEDLIFQLRQQYPTGRYWLAVLPNASEAGLNGENEAFVVDSDLVESGVTHLDGWDFHDLWRVAVADGVVSDTQRDRVPESFREVTSGLLEGLVFCGEDGLPMIDVAGTYVCSGEYLLTRLGSARVTDVLLEPTLCLVFSNGCILPLLCPDCGDSLHISGEDELLQAVTGRVLTEVLWDPEGECLLLEFSNEDTDEAFALEVHLGSAAGLSCPDTPTASG